MNDTVIFSFASADSVLTIRYYYVENENGLTEFVKIDTMYQIYLVEGSEIKFTNLDWQWGTLQNYNTFLFDYAWELTSFTGDELKINLHSRNNPTGSTILKSIPT